MNEFQVIRPFDGFEPGAILRDSDFASPHRAALLIDQHRITPLVGGKGYQPTVKSLLGSSVRTVRTLLPDVRDACVLAEALSRDNRGVAKEMYQKRIDEMNALQLEEVNDAQPTN